MNQKIEVGNVYCETDNPTNLFLVTNLGSVVCALTNIRLGDEYTLFHETIHKYLTQIGTPYNQGTSK